ncbi:hypothetical protein K493DRAFT_302777 [Basidiobolus meristosporus CBS 931.73]|uniref:Uncharacterized protein n=1 Tax=Basidiobolus meristosporus CBS 931.73 TaxID=1314790 RepID=A0A1Y1Y5I7_9FUNG|nr:hypothetical protein K493DRAFT_302777 [Basidiobolus meristosporus CBS 931.73]|eukprot:ORX93277.1 hypothetical protein K493DRAFT_302777 [Basidiobolus meristosporus CBS 931.73]
MRTFIVSLILGLASLQATISAPVTCSESCNREHRRVRYRRYSCLGQASNCYQQAQAQPTVETPNVQMPLLRQVFTTMTRKHDNLNTANANSDKSLDVQFQAGPSLEVDGSAGASEYAEQKGAEHSEDGTNYPIAIAQRAQGETYPTPVVDTQCTEGCSGQDTQHTEPMEDVRCGNDCANQDEQYTEPMEDIQCTNDCTLAQNN